MRIYEQLKPPKNWALDFFGEAKIQRALVIAERRILKKSLNSIMNINEVENSEEIEFLLEVSYLCEVAALEWWEHIRFPTAENESEQQNFMRVCSIAFNILRSVPLPNVKDERLYHILRVISLGYLSNRGTDVKRWIKESEEALLFFSLEGWSGTLITEILEAWLRLIRRDNWNDVNQIALIIMGLRKAQKEHEPTYLNSHEGSDSFYAAWQLVSLYHWAKATEVLAEFMLQGTPTDVYTIVDFHFDKAYSAADKSGSMELGNVLRWLQLTSHRLLGNSVWNVSKRFNSNITKYVQKIVSSHKTTLELLPPQRTAIFKEGLLDRTHNAVVVSLPTSSGKTHLAIFRILEAINHFGDQKCWIAYTAPTRALVNQIWSRLRKELLPLNIKVQRLNGAADVDQLEDDLLTDEGSFDVLVCTPEKLDVIVRQKKISRKLVLYIMDEAHSLEEEKRGFKHELTLAMIRRDCPSAKFLLLTPYVSNGMEIARWLDPQAPNTIGMSIDWQPNDRIIGKFWAERDEQPRDWSMRFESLATSHPSLELNSVTKIGGIKPLQESFSSISNNLTSLASAMAVTTHVRGTALIISQTKPSAWSAAKRLKSVLPEKTTLSRETESVINFLKAEYGVDYELGSLLKHGIAVHHSGLSEDARFLIEWLTEEEQIKVLCATTTIAQGINFPVSSILIASVKYPYGQPMKFREFWNLAGRAGRIGQPGVGLIGIASRSGDFANDDSLINGYLKQAHGDLLSSLLKLYSDAKQYSSKLNLRMLSYIPAWSAFLQYLAHLFSQSDKERLLGTQLELTLRDTFGYISLEKSNKEAAQELLSAVREYINYLDNHPENAKLAENTGFAPENAYSAMQQIRMENLQSLDWKYDKMFSSKNPTLRKLMGIMLRVPELGQLKELVGSGIDNKKLAQMASEWVNGQSLKEMALKYFGGTDQNALTNCCDAIYGKLINNATWGLASLQKLSGLDFDSMDEEERRLLNTMPAMIYYGVNTEEAVVMRMNGVPRSVAQDVGSEYKRQLGNPKTMNSNNALEWLANLDDRQWQRILPQNNPMSGTDCRYIWKKLSGLE